MNNSIISSFEYFDFSKFCGIIFATLTSLLNFFFVCTFSFEEGGFNTLGLDGGFKIPGFDGGFKIPGFDGGGFNTELVVMLFLFVPKKFPCLILYYIYFI